MLKINKFLPILTVIFSLCTLNAAADDSELRKTILNKFQQTLELKLNQGDETAKALAERAQKNAGDLKLEHAEMKKILLSWDPDTKKLFSQLETKEQKLKKIQGKFEALLKKKVLEEVPLAIRIAEKGEFNSGSLSLTVRQMQDLISKWEK